MSMRRSRPFGKNFQGKEGEGTPIKGNIQAERGRIWSSRETRARSKVVINSVTLVRISRGGQVTGKIEDTAERGENVRRAGEREIKRR